MTNNLTVKQPVRQFNSAELIIGLQTIPSHWALTPVDGEKSPYRRRWSSEKPLSRDLIKSSIKSGKAKGYGLRTGEVSGGLLAIDADGYAPEKLLQRLSGGDLPDTVIFSSGRPSRRQLLYAVPQKFWGVMKTIKINTKVKDDKGKWQHLEFRWDGCQSVLPPSAHPDTGAYYWMRSPQEVEVAQCPMWVVEFIINYKQPSSNQSASNQSASKPKPALNIPSPGGDRFDKAPLEIFLGKDDRHLVENGTGDGGRNDAAKKLSLNLVATARRLSELDIPFDGDPQVLYEQFCARCNPPLSKGEVQAWWRNVDAIAKEPCLDNKILQECYKKWLRRNNSKSNTSNNNHLGGKSIVYVDNSLLSTPLSTPKMDDEKVIQTIVGNVYTILRSNFDEFLERKKLNDAYSQYNGHITRKNFESIVASERVKLEEVLPEDEISFKSLMDYSQAKIDWDYVLPAPLARDIKHDADKLNIDPVMLWQALLPAVSSLAGQFKLDEYGGVPAINWTCTVLPSGKGKTRADSLVFSPLRKMQLGADEAYKNEAKEYKRAIAQYEKAGDAEVPEPEKPGLRKYLFEVATIQSVLKRLSEQGEHGSLWARDEIKGLFSSLNQFSGNENEATELVLKLWDNKPTFVDRADIENSYSIAGTAVSLTGGIQNDVFRKVFKDSNDGNGMQARFLFAVPEPKKKRYVPGAYCRLSNRLPSLYGWLEQLTPRTVKMAPEAQNYFAKLVENIGVQIEQIAHPGIRTWMNKIDTHILRIALALHLIECYYSSSTLETLSLDTLERAIAFAQYYRSAFHILQEKVSTSDSIPSILLQIHSAALNKHPDGISARDVYRESRIIQNRAKSANREFGAYVSDLFEKMAQMGYGEVVRKGRSVIFVANKIKNNSENSEGSKSVDNADNSLEPNPEKEKDCQYPCCQLPIVNVDNKKNTEKTENITCQKELPINNQQEPLIEKVHVPIEEEQTTVDNSVDSEQLVSEQSIQLQEEEVTMTDQNLTDQMENNTTQLGPEDFASGMEVVFNRQLASQSSSDRIPASVTKGEVVKPNHGTVLVKWEGHPIEENHHPWELEIAF